MYTKRNKSLLLFFLFFLKTAVYSQDTIVLSIDTLHCQGGFHATGILALYATDYSKSSYFVPHDTLIQRLEIRNEQSLVIPGNTYLKQFRLRYLSPDTTVAPNVFPLTQEYCADKKLRLNGYFFNQTIAFLDQMHDGDTLLLTQEYQGPSFEGQYNEQKTVRIIRKNGKYQYALNTLATSGNLVNPVRLTENYYEKTYSREKELNANQMGTIRKLEQELAVYLSNRSDMVFYEFRIEAKGNTYYFAENSERLNQIRSFWESL